jgi:hypothetical protein
LFLGVARLESAFRFLLAPLQAINDDGVATAVIRSYVAGAVTAVFRSEVLAPAIRIH